MEDAAVETVEPREDRPLSHLELEELQDLQIELRELANTRKFLQDETDRYTKQIDQLTQELDGIDISISATEAALAAYEERRLAYDENSRKLEARKEALTSEVNRLHLQIKAAEADEQSSALLIGSLKQELDEIRTEKGIIQRRLENLKAGINRIGQDRESRFPHLKTYDEVYRQVRTVLKDAQNRMEVSLKLRQKWDL